MGDFEKTGVRILLTEHGECVALVTFGDGWRVWVPLSREQVEAYNLYVRGDPTTPPTEAQGAPPNWWYRGIIEQAKRARE